MFSVDAKTRLFALFGDPVAHSLSPVMQNWFMQRFGVNGVYVAFQVPASRLCQAMATIPALGFGGVNLTIPHKEAALQWIDMQDEQVEILQAANTLRPVDGEIHAAVTDPEGFILSLGEKRDRFRHASVVMIGAGGSARSIAYALCALGVSRLAIMNRTIERAESLARYTRERLNLSQTIALQPADFTDALASADIIINTTSVGMHPFTSETLVADPRVFRSGQFVYDLIYNPAITRLLHDARREGAEIQNGLDMLIFQGLLSLNIWQQEKYELNPADLKTVRRLLKNRLGTNE
ncbi:shikimate dehydrogenase [candidate division KSB1 bacterium]|nr:shikimate dehydrogenase [candidate division KSB1 bacterium]